jgi:site-specific recombinase XerC
MRVAIVAAGFTPDEADDLRRAMATFKYTQGPLHVPAWIEQQTREHAAPTAKLRLAALRHLFDWLVTGQVMPTNPAGSVRGPAPWAAKTETSQGSCNS